MSIFPEWRRPTRTFQPGGDPYFSSVSLLLHMNGSNGSTTFTDSSSYARQITKVGAPVISTSVSKFNGSAGSFDGSSYLQVTIPNGFGTGDFALEYWFYRTTGSVYVFNSRTGGSGSDGVDIKSNCEITTQNTYIATADNSLFDNYWYHVAFVRRNGGYTRFIDGVASATNALSNNFTGGTFLIGGNYNFMGYGLFGAMAELRLTVGVARYTANFTPPTAPFPDF
jgi:hypothetical protein